jgi:hypothetical protein
VLHWVRPLRRDVTRRRKQFRIPSGSDRASIYTS